MNVKQIKDTLVIVLEILSSLKQNKWQNKNNGFYKGLCLIIKLFTNNLISYLRQKETNQKTFCSTLYEFPGN